MAANSKPSPERAGDREKSLETALLQIERQFGKGSVMRLGEETRVPVEVIPTGSIALDVALGRILGGRDAIKYYEAGMDLGWSSNPVESFRLFQGTAVQRDRPPRVRASKSTARRRRWPRPRAPAVRMLAHGDRARVLAGVRDPRFARRLVARRQASPQIDGRPQRPAVRPTGRRRRYDLRFSDLDRTRSQDASARRRGSAERREHQGQQQGRRPRRRRGEERDRRWRRARPGPRARPKASRLRRSPPAHRDSRKRICEPAFGRWIES